MSKTQTLKAEVRLRTGSGVLKQMRREGYVPSVIYGGGTENRNVKVVEKSFTDLLAHSVSENILVNLELEGGGTQSAFLKSVQHDPLSGRVLHIDFLAVNQKTEITAQIPVEVHGESVGVKKGGVLEQQLHAVEIRCLAKDLPEVIDVHVDDLDIGDALHVGQVTWPAGVVPTVGEEVVVVMIAKARVEEEEPETEVTAEVPIVGSEEKESEEEKSED